MQYGPGNQTLLKEACFVVNVLDPKVKRDLLSWFVKLQLSEYVVLFAEGEDVSAGVPLWSSQWEDEVVSVSLAAHTTVTSCMVDERFSSVVGLLKCCVFCCFRLFVERP